ncbi:hypothetical protein MtrunA17_Chr8g0386181 [Medicago truncatula]|uniref:Uncharacterized protein n=1 Tax=Medicago truncatula TaxID=3880 RepID=A0A396GSD4_MEDTR|nr:hypothetical protein MtrunA17_Chr8g0386181 [Medicago truncatula]
MKKLYRNTKEIRNFGMMKKNEGLMWRSKDEEIGGLVECVSPSIHHAPPSSGSSYLLVSSLLVSPQTDRHVCTAVATLCANEPTACLGHTLRRSGL